jgi:hypothetical protein
MKKEIYMGHGLYKQVEVIETIEGDVEWRIVETESGGFIRRPFKIQTESLRMQDELEPIIHPTQHDESDDLEAAKREEMTEFEKSEYKRKTEKRKLEEPDYTDAYWKREFYNLDSSKEEVEWKIVELEGGGSIKRPFPVKKATLAGPDRPETDSSRLIKRVEKHYFSKGEKWEWKNDT